MKSIYANYLELWASCTAFLPGCLSTALSQSKVATNTHPYWFQHCLPPGWELQQRHLLCMLVDNTGTTTSAIIRTVASAIYFGPGGVLEVLAPVCQYARQGTGTSLFCLIRMCWWAPDSLQPCPDLLQDMNLSPVSYTAFCPELNKLIQISCQFSIQTFSRLENGCQSSMQWLSFHTVPVMFRPQWLYLCTIKPVHIYKKKLTTQFSSPWMSISSSSDTKILLQPWAMTALVQVSALEELLACSVKYIEAACMICSHLRLGRLHVDWAYWHMIPPQGLLSNPHVPVFIFSSQMLTPIWKSVNARSSYIAWLVYMCIFCIVDFTAAVLSAKAPVG